MARGTESSKPAEPGKLLVPREEFRAEIDARIRAGEELRERPMASSAEYETTRALYYTWTEFNEELLKRRFTSPEVAEGYASWVGIGGSPESLREQIDDLREDIGDKLRRLTSVRERIPLFEEAGVVPTVGIAGTRKPGVGRVEAIFVVHGRDTAAELAVHGFLKTVTDIEVIVLHGEPNGGRTVLEKFEAAGSRAGFAVVLLTADDVGRFAGGDETSLDRRARQNVVWEFGFFVGALGRRRVAVLREDGVDIPSDLHGLVYIPFEHKEGGWKLALARELKEAGINVDSEKVISS